MCDAQQLRMCIWHTCACTSKTNRPSLAPYQLSSTVMQNLLFFLFSKIFYFTFFIFLNFFSWFIQEIIVNLCRKLQNFKAFVYRSSVGHGISLRLFSPDKPGFKARSHNLITDWRKNRTLSTISCRLCLVSVPTIWHQVSNVKSCQQILLGFSSSDRLPWVDSIQFLTPICRLNR